MTKACKNDVYLLPSEDDEKDIEVFLAACGLEPPVLAVRGEQGRMVGQASQTDWSCRPDTVCLLANTAEQAVEMARRWRSNKAEEAMEPFTETEQLVANEATPAGSGSDCGTGLPLDDALISACGKGNKAEKAMEPSETEQLVAKEATPAGSGEQLWCRPCT